MPLTAVLRRLRALFHRAATHEVHQAAQVLLLGFTPADAWQQARGRRRKASNEAEDDHWTAVMREIERQTGYQHGADVAARYEIANEREARDGRTSRRTN